LKEGRKERKNRLGGKGEEEGQRGGTQENRGKVCSERKNSAGDGKRSEDNCRREGEESFFGERGKKREKDRWQKCLTKRERIG